MLRQNLPRVQLPMLTHKLSLVISWHNTSEALPPPALSLWLFTIYQSHAVRASGCGLMPVSGLVGASSGNEGKNHPTKLNLDRTPGESTPILVDYSSGDRPNQPAGIHSMAILVWDPREPAVMGVLELGTRILGLVRVHYHSSETYKSGNDSRSWVLWVLRYLSHWSHST